MSATSMANVAIYRGTAAAQSGTGPGGVTAIARAAEGAGAPGAAAPPDNAFTAAMKAVTTYIPTEVLTLYIAGAAIYLNTDGTEQGVDYDRAWLIFFGALIATPLVNALVFAAKLRSAGVAMPRDVRQWPVWESIAATIAFVAVAATLPDTPFEDRSWYDRAFAGFLLGVVSLFLGLISSIITPIRADNAPTVAGAGAGTNQPPAIVPPEPSGEGVG